MNLTESWRHSWNPTIMCFDNSWWIAFTFPFFWGCQWHSLKQTLYLSYSNTPPVLSRPLGNFFKLISEPEVGSRENISISGSWSSPGLPFSQVVWKEQGFITRKPRAWDSQPYELFWKHLKPLGTHILLRNVVLWILREYKFILDPRVAGHESRTF